ncbi:MULTISPECIES: DUF3899 domain-containing protein [unclassified Sporosarcina]|uniref:DUF3899 domain-containing protein n=1 Tax=unclassified Sporosarcina TaxID=2647733 RepID=UPI00203E84A1|nr:MULTISPECIES: DUF3899 domain-containing protein [unclassified Sporosarcina]GKV67457.1 hypothetical protein NCCP2331_36100 [Sporosarcina sp. NCCP-2331]GLB57814.1 hypothetical protein NCCP2378_36070 [Sporosarcina sp. NCCP-2378]
MKNYSVSALLLVALYAFFWGYFSWSIVDLINLSFMIGLISLLLFVILKIIRSGFFDLFITSMHQFKSFIFRKSNAEIRIEKKLSEDIQLQEFKERAYESSHSILLAIAVTSLAVSLSLLYFYI